MPDAVTLKSIRTRLRETEDNELSGIHEITKATDLISKLNHCKKVRPVSLKEQRHELGWYELMSQNNPPSNLEEAYGLLPPELKTRLRSVWKTNPIKLEQFCSDVISFSGMDFYRLVLKNQTFFQAYRSRLGDERISSAFQDWNQDNDSNHYRRLNDLLIQSHQVHAVQPEPIKDFEDIESIDFNRLIIWGGQYDRAAKQKIRESVGSRIEIYDIFNRKTDVSHLREGDVVVCVTASMSHPLEKAIRQKCDSQGIPFYRYGRGGYSSLIGFLEEKGIAKQNQTS
jgi:hypothetical protein